jgi:AbiV family abortive infection protein
MNANDLVQGSFYALANAGRLIHDAVFLFKDQRYASAVTLAVYCREELGRARILLDRASSLAPDQAITPQDVRDACNQHLAKLRHGQAATVLRFHAGPPKGLSTLAVDPMHPQYREARTFIDAATGAKRKRDPDDAHELREQSLYVEPDESGSWNQPPLLSPTAAYNLVNDVAGDYSSFWHDAPSDPLLGPLLASTGHSVQLQRPLFPDRPEAPRERSA